MNNQKVNFIPTVNNVQIVDFDFENDITTDIIDMPASNKAWAIQINELVATGTPSMTIKCSNDGVNFVNYSTATSGIDILLTTMIFDTDFCPRYMILSFKTGVGAAPGDTISISMIR